MAALQVSDKCSHTNRMLGTTTFPIGLTPFEHLNVLRLDAKSPHKREPLSLIRGFETTSSRAETNDLLMSLCKAFGDKG